MQARNRLSLTRRSFARGLGAMVLFAPSIVRAQTIDPVRRNVSSFRTHAWQDHFDALGVGLIISDTNSKVLQHWTTDGEMRLYPTSVPLSEDLTRLGYTEVVEKRENPSWAPTPSMRERNPEWPARIPGATLLIRSGLGRCTCLGSITVFTAPRTRERSGEDRPTAASVFTMNTLKRCLNAHPLGPRSN